ncbi:carboxylesterase [Xylariales sp. PMI_506]|nr:carboxylesterase [Xylariales sp. PMI_506]
MKWTCTILSCILLILTSVIKGVNGEYDAALTVQTRTGTYTGLQNPDFPNVREFRNIPFAQPPVGHLRFKAPQPLPASTEHHYSTRYPPNCPQFSTGTPTLWNAFVPYLLPNNGAMNRSSGLSLLTSSEDCLSLAVWTPYGVSADAKLPVAFFMTGGGFSANGVYVEGQLPPQWVNRTQEHIVVTINYRMNFFGFPNAAGGDSANLGILDQRQALEWVYENIAAFGGDTTRIMLWGQSAGSQSVDYHNYAFYEKPLYAGSFSQSGTALKALASRDYSHSNFTFVARNLGCDFPGDAASELECMQQVPFAQIEYYLGTYNKSGGPLAFGPIADEVVIFSDYPARAREGKIAQRPAIFSDTANNDASLTAWPAADPAAGVNQTAVTASTLANWVCPTANTSLLRAAAGLTTYRSQYAGNFSNQTPYAWLGAYHAADLVMNFGTYTLNRTNATEGVTALEVATSEAMQDHILAFMKDPVSGPAAIGWLPYTYGGSVIRFGGDGIAAQNVSGYEIDGPCFGNGTYDPFP